MSENSTSEDEDLMSSLASLYYDDYDSTSPPDLDQIYCESTSQSHSHKNTAQAEVEQQPATQEALDDPKIPHVILTNDDDWHLHVLDNEFSDPDIWHDADWQGLEGDPDPDPFIEPRFGETGNYLHR